MKPVRRVGHILAPGPMGGLERCVELIAIGQVERSKEVHAVLILDRPGHPLIEALEAGGVRVHSVCAGHRRYWRQLTATIAALRTARVHLLHTHGYHANFIGYWARRSLRIPVVSTAHGYTGGPWKNRAYEWLDRQVLRRFHAVIAVAAPLKERLVRAGLSLDRVHLVRNGIPIADVLPREEARKRL